MSKMTDWFPPHIKPVREGIYEVKDPFWGAIYSYWTGKRWTIGGVYFSPTFGPHSRQLKTELQDRSWRGFTEEQK